MFVCFTDRNNNIIKGPFKRIRDSFKQIGYAWEEQLEYIEHEELTPTPLIDYEQDEYGFFEEK